MKKLDQSVFAERCYANASVAVLRCLSVRPSVRHLCSLHSVRTNKHIYNFFAQVGSQTIIVFSYQTAWQYFDGNPPPPSNGGVEFMWDMLKLRFWAYISHSGFTACCYAATLQVLSIRRRRTTVRKLWHCAGSKRRYLLMAGKDDEMFITRSFNVTPKTTEQHLIARSDKSVAYVTNNKRLCSTFCTIEANYLQTRCIARPLCDSRATCYSHQSVTLPPLCLCQSSQWTLYRAQSVRFSHFWPSGLDKMNIHDLWAVADLIWKFHKQ